MDETPLIALVDNEANMREVVTHALKKEGYRVTPYRDGQEAWDAIERSLPDMVIIDIIMPRMDGLELCRKIRSRSAHIPLIFLTSRDEEFDRVLGLELGADDYLCKPFSIRELIARIRVLLRRTSMSRDSGELDGRDSVQCGPLQLDLLRFTASWNGASVPLTVTDAYPDDSYVSDRSVDTHIKRIRRKIMLKDPDFAGVETIYGLVYRYRLPAQR